LPKRGLPQRDMQRAREWSEHILSAPKMAGVARQEHIAKHLLQRSAIYAIGRQIGPPIKIGFSSKPVYRLTELQVSSPEELRFHLVCWLQDRSAASKIEARCHAILRGDGRHIRGEWFNITPDEAAKIIDRAALDIECRIVPHPQLIRRFPASHDPLAGYFWI